MRLGLAGLGLALAVLCLLAQAPPHARADVFGSISLVSEGAVTATGTAQQAEYAHDPAISGDGRYVAFDGSIGGVTGVWRRDLLTGAVQQVAGGDAELPSISQDGQRISFTTNEGRSLPRITRTLSGEPPVAGAGEREAVDVYVRDMGRGPEEEGAFLVASAPDGSAEPLSYAGSSTILGATAAGRSAISADGNEVAFVTTAVSNLAGPSTPALQVAVRYLDTGRTVLVSRCYASCLESVAPAVYGEENGLDYGAVFPGRSAAFEAPAAYGGSGASLPGASVSADGSTVTWMGQDIGQQAPLLAGETRRAVYAEPLWRRIAPGSETATERVTGGSDPLSPQCQASGERSLPSAPSPADPCQGPFLVGETGGLDGILAIGAGGEVGDFVPRVSADGRLVAFISEAPLSSVGENFGRGGGSGQASDLYLATMQPGLIRVQALRALTELAGGEAAGIGATAPIVDFAVSSDGGQVAFTTARTEFPLGSPAYVSEPQAEPGMDELFDVDLADDTLTRVTHGYASPQEASEHVHEAKSAGEDPYARQPADGALSPSFSADGMKLSFASTASNLAFGDGNSPPAGPLDGSDSFLVERQAFAPVPTPEYRSPAPQTSIAPAWRLGVSGVARGDGTILLYLEVPAAGMLRAQARSAVPLRPAARGARRARRASSRARATVVARTVAVAGETVQEAGGEPIELILRLSRAYAPLASRGGGLAAEVTVSFAAAGRPQLRQTIELTFRRTARVSRHGHSARRKRRRR